MSEAPSLQSKTVKRTMQGQKPGSDVPFIREIQLANLLSFGPKTPRLSLGPLNVLIGPNGAGKSNLIEALALMRATPVSPDAAGNGDVRSVLRRSGGVGEWIWKGGKAAKALIGVEVWNPQRQEPLAHFFQFYFDGEGFGLSDEIIIRKPPPGGKRTQSSLYSFHGGKPSVSLNGGPMMKALSISIDKNVSIVAQLKHPKEYPEISLLADTYQKWRIYREWSFGRNTVFRTPQRADNRNDRLEEDFSNLGLFLSRLGKSPKAKRDIVDGLSELYEGFTNFEVIVEGGSVQVFFTEGDFSIPATRLSDGTLRYLCLLAILCDPTPPPLVCIEEPELGLHPDIIPSLARHLVAASERTQLIVTTHSDILVDALSDCPESVVICEKHDGATQMTRLNKDDMKVWLEKYRLGELWIQGQLGGKRW